MSVLINSTSRRLSTLLLSKHNQSIPFSSAICNGRYNFHTSTTVFAKDTKKPAAEVPKKEKSAPSQATTQKPATKPQAATQKPSAQSNQATSQKPLQGKVIPNAAPQKTVLQGENMPRAVFRGPESLEDIRSNIAKLCDEEIEFLNETSGVAGAISSEFVKEYLDHNEFQIEEAKDGIVKLTKQLQDQTVTITFDKFEPEGGEEIDESDLEEEQEENENEDEEDEQNEGEEGVEDGSNELPYKHNITIEVAFKDNNGAQKGKWLLYGFAGKDSRLYIQDMAINKGQKELSPSEEERDQLEAIPFQSLSDDLQDRLYDYLDELGVDDQLANFVKRYLVEAESKSAAKFLNNLKELMK